MANKKINDMVKEIVSESLPLMKNTIGTVVKRSTEPLDIEDMVILLVRTFASTALGMCYESAEILTPPDVPSEIKDQLRKLMIRTLIAELTELAEETQALEDSLDPLDLQLLHVIPKGGFAN